VAVHCDIVLIADTAFIADTHVAVGLVAGDGGAVAWPLMMSLLKAVPLTSDRIRGAAVCWGGESRIPAADVASKALALAARAQLPQAGRTAALNLHLRTPSTRGASPSRPKPTVRH
jgi:enoyl-CoA hydratase